MVKSTDKKDASLDFHFHCQQNKRHSILIVWQEMRAIVWRNILHCVMQIPLNKHRKFAAEGSLMLVFFPVYQTCRIWLSITDIGVTVIQMRHVQQKCYRLIVCVQYSEHRNISGEIVSGVKSCKLSKTLKTKASEH